MRIELPFRTRKGSNRVNLIADADLYKTVMSNSDLWRNVQITWRRTAEPRVQPPFARYDQTYGRAPRALPQDVHSPVEASGGGGDEPGNGAGRGRRNGQMAAQPAGRPSARGDRHDHEARGCAALRQRFRPRPADNRPHYPSVQGLSHPSRPPIYPLDMERQPPGKSDHGLGEREARQPQCARSAVGAGQQPRSRRHASGSRCHLRHHLLPLCGCLRHLSQRHYPGRCSCSPSIPRSWKR